MKAAREALGGEKKLNALTGLSLRIEFRRDASSLAMGGPIVMMRGGAGGGEIAGTLDIDVLFPDKFYREETTRSGLAMTRIDGFDGDRPFMEVAAANPGTRVFTPPLADDPARLQAALRRANADLARLLLGLIAGTHAPMPVTYTWAGEAESAETVADIIDVAGPNEFKARLFVDSATHLPLMLTYIEPEPRVRMMTHRGASTPPAGTAAGSATARGEARGSGAPVTPPDLTAEERAKLEQQLADAAAESPKLVEHRLYFADYRRAGGLMLPHRISRGIAEKTTEEWTVRKYEVNPRVKADRFDVGKE